jgi:cytochrome P450
MDFDWAFSLAPYGEVWRRKRKLMHAHMHQGVVDRYHPIQVASARRLARDILITEAKPESISRAVCLNFGQTIVKTMYGIEVEGHQSEYITLAEEVTARINEAAVPGRFLIDFIPARKL